MGREERSFDQAYREFLPEEQRREVLKALREKLDPETTFGQIVDAARTLGWEDALGEVLLSELASTLLNQEDEAGLDSADARVKPGAVPLSGRARQLEAAIVEGLTNWSEDQDQDQDQEVEQESLWQDGEDVEEEAEAPLRPKRGRPAKKKTAKKRASKKRGAKKKASKKRASKKKASKKRTSKKTSKKRGAKKKASKKRASKKKAGKKRSSKKKVSKKRSTKKRATKKKASKKRGKKKSSRRR